jgi:hypothetical protein
MDFGPDKQHDEKFEDGGLEAGMGGGGEDSRAMRRVVFKMDVRYVEASSHCQLTLKEERFAKAMIEFYPSSRSCSCVPSSTARMLGMRRFWDWRRIFILLIISMRLGCVFFTLRILRGKLF